MPRQFDSTLSRTIDALPSCFRGPGGAVAVIREGETIVRHAWGYANMASRTVLTPTTIMPICSITKQFTCAVLLDRLGGLSDLDSALAQYLPMLEGQRPSLVELCNNQSGLRDYPALSILCGADGEGEFRLTDARHLLTSMRSTHFVPGTQYSYSNSNFHILSDLLEERFDRPLGDLIADGIFGPANMTSARYQSDSGAYPIDCTGYEGSSATGFVPAINRSHWSGDAGISTSLDDMIAYEKFIDDTRDDEHGLYRRLSVPQTFSDGSEAPYGFGLAHRTVAGTKVTGHAGGMRGWRLYRLHAAAHRVSVVVMFNHEGDVRQAADLVLSASLCLDGEAINSNSTRKDGIKHYIDDVSGLSVSIASVDAHLTAKLLDSPEALAPDGYGFGRSAAMVLSHLEHNLISCARPNENFYATMSGLSGEVSKDLEGKFHCDEIDADLILARVGGQVFATFDGFLGKSNAHPVYPIGPDVWLVPTYRAIDVTPGEWTLRVQRDSRGVIAGFTIGCWLARNLRYTRL